MNSIIRSLLIAIAMIVLLVGVIWYVNNNDIQSLGDSHIAFTIEDAYPRYNGASLYKKDYYQYPCEWHNDSGTRIINPSPQRCELQLTNVETGQVFTIRHRDTLNGNHYMIVRMSLNGEVISNHELIIR